MNTRARLQGAGNGPAPTMKTQHARWAYTSHHGTFRPPEGRKALAQNQGRGAPVQNSCLKAPGPTPLGQMPSACQPRALTHGVPTLENLKSHV